MTQGYEVEKENNSLEIRKQDSTILVYKIPYKELKKGSYGFDIQNQFIVYILYGKNIMGKDAIYVGKSINGLLTRPTSHDDKYENWSFCYIITQENRNTSFNNGVIQYLENKINTKLDKLKYLDNKTGKTSSGTVNKKEQRNCDKYLEDCYNRLYVLGLNLLEEDSSLESIGSDKKVNEIENKEISENNGYKINEKIKPLFNKLNSFILSIDENIDVDCDLKTYVKYTLFDENIIGLETSSKSIGLTFDVKDPILEKFESKLKNPNKYVSKLKNIAGKNSRAPGDYQIRIKNIENINDFDDITYINDIGDIIRQIIEHKKSE